jgi:hypothetical protein
MRLLCVSLRSAGEEVRPEEGDPGCFGESGVGETARVGANDEEAMPVVAMDSGHTWPFLGMPHLLHL